jgi:hypothetical protein
LWRVGLTMVSYRVVRRVIACTLALAATWTGCLSLASPSPAPPEATRTVDVLPTPTPPDPPPTDCPHMPLGGFNDVWRDTQVYPRLGCATDPAEPISGTEAYLCCMHSIWVRESGLFVAIADHRMRWTFVGDESGLPPDAALMVAPVPRLQPCFPATGRHGWLARSPAWAEVCQGAAWSDETAFSGAMQAFEGGWLLWNGNVCFVLFSDGTWTMF